MSVLESLGLKLLREPWGATQWLVYADCLQEMGFHFHAAATRAGYSPDVCQVYFGHLDHNGHGSKYETTDANRTCYGAGCDRVAEGVGGGCVYGEYRGNSFQII